MWAISFGVTSGLGSGTLNAIQSVLFDAANYWGRYIDFFSGRIIEINVNIVSLDPDVLAQAGPEHYEFTRTLNGSNVLQAGPIFELQTGVDPNGSAEDIVIDINLDTINAGEFYFGGLSQPDVTTGQFDLFTVLAHEIGHGLGFLSLDPIGPGDNFAEFDTFINGDFFTGSRAVALFGGSVPLQPGDGSHLDIPALLFPSIAPGFRTHVSAIDVAILADVGLPVLRPTAGDDVLEGFERIFSAGSFFGGDDTIDLLEGDDFFIGRSGDDSVLGGAGNDTIYAGWHETDIPSFDGNDTVRGGEGDDVIYDGINYDFLYGDAGNDIFRLNASPLDSFPIFGQIFGGPGFDVADFSGVTFPVRFRTQDSVFNLFDSIERHVFGEGDDTVEGGPLNEDFVGNGGADRLLGDGGADTLAGGAGNDTLDGGAAVDTADYSATPGAVSVNLSTGQSISDGTLNASGFYVGGALEDTLISIENIVGSEFGDRLVAASAGSMINGGGGGDRISGLGGQDSFLGGAGADTIEGGANADTIQGGLGNDTLDGGTAFDTLDYSDKTGGVNVNVINGVALTGGFINASGFYQGGAQEDTILNFENILGTGVADRLIAGSTSARIEGRGGNDFLFTFSGNDTLFGGEGNDFISTANSTDRLFGENGNDTLNGGTGLDTLDGGAGLDTADYADRTGGVNVNLFSGAAITGGALNASGFYVGGFTEDSLVSIESATGSSFGDRLVASLASGRLDGRGGDDNLSGLTGNDTLVGGAGNDTLAGGAGNDTFEFASGAGADRITDFAEGAGAGDVIRLVGLGAAFDSFAEVIAAASQSGGDVVFNLGGGNTITVANATVAGFAADDFTFG